MLLQSPLGLGPHSKAICLLNPHCQPGYLVLIQGPVGTHLDIILHLNNWLIWEPGELFTWMWDMERNVQLEPAMTGESSYLLGRCLLLCLIRRPFTRRYGTILILAWVGSTLHVHGELLLHLQTLGLRMPSTTKQSGSWLRKLSPTSRCITPMGFAVPEQDEGWENGQLKLSKDARQDGHAAGQDGPLVPQEQVAAKQVQLCYHMVNWLN